MTEIKPNIVIVKLDDTLVSFPLSEDGTIDEGKAFESDYILEEHNIVLASYNDETNSSKELYRFSVLTESNEEERVKVLYDNGKFADLVKQIVKDQLGNI